VHPGRRTSMAGPQGGSSKNVVGEQVYCNHQIPHGNELQDKTANAGATTDAHDAVPVVEIECGGD
jgi:hypothetical protein